MFLADAHGVLAPAVGAEVHVGKDLPHVDRAAARPAPRKPAARADGEEVPFFRHAKPLARHPLQCAAKDRRDDDLPSGAQIALNSVIGSGHAATFGGRRSIHCTVRVPELQDLTGRGGQEARPLLPLLGLPKSGGQSEPPPAGECGHECFGTDNRCSHQAHLP